MNKSNDMTLKEKLSKKSKNRWLDVGCGGNLESGFYYLDTFPVAQINPQFKDKYFRADIVNMDVQDLQTLGKFDLVRLQHVLEHFTFEDGQKVLNNCALLLNDDGIILITVPDLTVHIQKYLHNDYKNWEGFKWWASKRIPPNAPDSFYFSIFAHSMSYESHKWCYDFAGVKYQLEMSKKFNDIMRVDFSHPLASHPFTHNRPEEDVCVIAKKFV